MIARRERKRGVDLLEAVVEEDLRRDSEVVPQPDAAAEPLVLRDGEVLRGRLRRVVDEDVAVAEEVARGVVEQLGVGDPVRAQELRIGEASAKRELLVGHGEGAAESDARTGEVRLGHRRAAVRGERAREAVRVHVLGDAEPDVVDDERVALDQIDDQNDVSPLRSPPERELHVAEEARTEQAEARQRQLRIVDVEDVARVHRHVAQDNARARRLVAAHLDPFERVLHGDRAGGPDDARAGERDAPRGVAGRDRLDGRRLVRRGGGPGRGGTDRDRRRLGRRAGDRRRGGRHVRRVPPRADGLRARYCRHEGEDER